MKLAQTNDIVSVWLNAAGAPERLVWNGVRYRVSDVPTPLEDILLAAVTHPPAISGWRFQGTSEAGETHVFDVKKSAWPEGWTLMSVYD